MIIICIVRLLFGWIIYENGFFDIFYVWVNERVFILVKGIKVKFFVKWKYIEILKIVMIKLYLDLD